MKLFEFLKNSMPASKNKSKGKKGAAASAEDITKTSVEELKEPSEAKEVTESVVKAEAAEAKANEAAAKPVKASSQKPAVVKAEAAGAKNKGDNAKPKEEKAVVPQAEVIAGILDKLGLTTEKFSDKDKLDALCLIFKQTLTENVQMKESVTNMKSQLEKNDLTKSALQKLCDALRTQVELKEDENNLRLMEETQKRIEITKNFETTMADLSKLIEKHSEHNASLRDENVSMASKLQELLKDYETREARVAHLSEEFRLKTQLHEAQLSKAKIEKAELSADFSKERLELQRDLLEAKKNIDILLSREENLKEQVELYASQYESMAKGVDDKKNNMGQFRAQMDKLNKKLKHLEVDTAMWKDKFEESNTVVVKMNTVKAESDRELESTKKKLMAMEKLNRALQAERANLLAEAKATKNGT